MKIDLTEKQIQTVMMGLAWIAGSADPSISRSDANNAISTARKLGFIFNPETSSFDKI